ncbi:MAG: dihydropyrimidinase [Clostridia bacterium]
MAIIIKNGSVVTEKEVATVDLKIEGEKITFIAKDILASPEDTIIDATGKIVMPGGIDAHVHYYMLSGDERTIDSFESASKAAIMGGVTSVVDYAEPEHEANLLEVFKTRLNEANKHIFTDFNLHMVVNDSFAYSLDELTKVRAAGMNSLKIFTTYGSSRTYEANITKLLVAAKAAGMFVTIHAEDDDTVEQAKKALIAAGKATPAYHGECRPLAAELIAVKNLIEMAKAADATIYIVHTSSGSAASLMRNAQLAGVEIYGETCPHYLVLDLNLFKGEHGQWMIMSPPLRQKEEQRELWEALADGTIESITTDHCSFSVAQKESAKTCYETKGGIPGTETMLPIIFSEGVQKGRISLEKFVQICSTNPAKRFGLYPTKGVLAVGSDADVTIIDPEKKVVLQGKELHSLAGYTPFEGLQVQGYPVFTMLRGKIMMENGSFLAEMPTGKFIPVK